MIARKQLLKEFGVSRKVLDRYNELGLLCPSNIDEIKAGKQVGQKPEWKYEDDAYNKLYFIEILRFIGYEPSEIKNLIEESESILDDIMSMLVKKKKDLEKMINFVKIMQITSNVPETTIAALTNCNSKYMLNNQNIRDRLEYIKENISENIGDLELDDDDIVIKLSNLIFSIIGYQDKEPGSDEVQSFIWEVYSIYMKKRFEKSKYYKYLDECLSYSKFISEFVNEIENDFIKENMEYFKSIYDEKSINYIIDALDFFREKHDRKTICNINE